MATYSPQQLGITAPSGGFQTGGWYSGRQYWNGTLSDAGVIHPESNQQGAGQAVNQEVRAASAASQGVSLQQFDQYLANVSAQSITPGVTPAYTTGANQNYVTGLNQEVEKARRALEVNLSEQRGKTQAELAAAKEKETKALGEVDKLTTPFREDLEKTERERYGTDEVIFQQKELLNELDQLLTEGNDLIRQQQETTGLAAIRNPRIQKTMDDVSARAGVINAVVSLQNTYLANAYHSIDRSIGAITQDRMDRLGYYETVLNLANRDIITLTADDKKLAEEQTNLLKNDLGRAQATADYIKELMINPSTAMAMAQSGVTLNDSVEVINQKMAQYQYASEVRENSNQFTAAGGVLVSDPTGIPANRLKSFTDSKGKTYYYKMPATGSGSTTSSADDYLKNMLLTDTPSSTSYQSITDTTKPQGQEPQFSPAGGVGTVYVDPTTGSIWQYTNSGWKKIA